jgi:hypothetical protein
MDSDDAARAGRAADAALHRLDDAFQQYLAERSATAYNVEDVAALVGGAARVRRAAQSLAALGRMTEGNERVGRCARDLEGELHALHAWYIALGYALTNRRQGTPTRIGDNGQGLVLKLAINISLAVQMLAFAEGLLLA